MRHSDQAVGDWSCHSCQSTLYAAGIMQASPGSLQSPSLLSLSHSVVTVSTGETLLLLKYREKHADNCRYVVFFWHLVNMVSVDHDAMESSGMSSGLHQLDSHCPETQIITGRYVRVIDTGTPVSETCP